jgi:hypothetical protein
LVATEKKARQPPAERKAVSGAEWNDAVRQVARTLRKLHVNDADERAQDAVVKAVATWRGDNGATLATLATTIALNKRTDDARKEIRAKQPRVSKAVGRPGEEKALAPALERFFAHWRTMLDAPTMWKRNGGPGGSLQRAIDEFLPALYEITKVPKTLRPILCTGSTEDEREAFRDAVNAYARRVRGLTERGWVQSAETLDMRPPGIAGKPPRDPYAAGDHGAELQEIFVAARRGLAPMIFGKKRRAVVDAVIRFALTKSGLSGARLNAILQHGRVREHRRRNAAG